MQLLKIYSEMKRKANYILSPKELGLKKNHKKSIILMGGPEYGNLGDHAIAYATQKFLSSKSKGYDYVELTEDDILYNVRKIKDAIKSEDILLLQGGGNTGDLYPDQEKVRKIVLREFPNNKVILMPQTIYFKKNAYAEIYYQNSNLVMCARERKSYEIMKDLYTCKIILTPDIVFSLFNNMVEKNIERKGGLICLRDDCEKIKDGVSAQKLSRILTDMNIQSEYISTVRNYAIRKAEREKELESLLNKYRSAQIVFTDRLHGMIFAVITKTPCVVFPTFNHKVIQSYMWIEKLGYIRLCDNIDNIKEIIDYVLSCRKDEEINFDEKFRPLLMEMNANEEIY